VGLHTVLGANGIIARELSISLALFNIDIRQVSRHPRKVNPSDETVVADLLDASAVASAVTGSDVVYLVAGLQYNLTIWQDQWPRIMRNVIEACKQHGARLVFFDNVYAYGYVQGVMTEETLYHPTSQKGEVRAKIATMLLDEVHAGNLSAMIARAADFYGPNAVLSFPYATIFKRLKAGKTPQWLGRADKVHTFTYTPDAGRALAVLGRSPEAYNQTWHLPTTKELFTGAEFVKLASELAGRPDKLQVIPPWMMKLLELFIPVLRENAEMMYQFNENYRFDSSKIEAAYDLHPTSYREGMLACLRD